LAVPPAKEREAWQKTLAELTQKKEQLERDLARDSASFRQAQAQRQRTPAEVQQALPADTVLLDFLQFTHSTPPPDGKGEFQREQHLAVFVVRTGQPIRQVDLGSPDRITKAVEQWRARFIDGKDVPGDPAL